MAALNADRNTQRRVGNKYTRPVKGGVKIYAGALVCLNAAGFAVPGATATTLTADGRSQEQIDNTTGADGAVTVSSRPGIYHYDNSANADLITAANVNANCYVVDDHTVALTSGGNTRSVAGKIADVDAQGVWVAIGTPSYEL